MNPDVLICFLGFFPSTSLPIYDQPTTNRPTASAGMVRFNTTLNRYEGYNGTNWIRYEDNVRMTLNNTGFTDVVAGTFIGKQVRETQKTGFINNNTTSTINGSVVVERQALSKALKPQADN